MKTLDGDRRGWVLVSILLLVGFLCVFAAAGWAIRFPSSWSLNADMGSRLDPNSEYLTLPANPVIQPLDPSILTPPVWIGFFLTPGATVPTRQPNPATATENVLPTQAVTQVVNTTEHTASPTSTIGFVLPTQTIKPAATPTSTSKAPAEPTKSTSTPMPSPPPEPTQTPSNVPPPQADLQITKNNGVVVYSAGSPLTYMVVVTNNGPADVIGAVLSDAFQPNLASWSWACTSLNNGATGCDPTDNGTSNFSDTINLPAGASIAYTVSAIAHAEASGGLVNTASIALPAGITDPVPGNNSASDTDDFLYPLPYGNIGEGKDEMITVVAPGGSVTLAFSTALVVGGHPGWDLILYELRNDSGIAMDLITLQIGDGTNWYTVFNWGDNVPDTNTNLDISVLGGEERDNRSFTAPPQSDVLYDGTGIVIELDGVVPDGTYPYIRILSPGGGDLDGGCEIDAIVIFP